MFDIIINILLADDDIDDCLFFQEALDELPIACSLEVVNNGEELINHLNNKINPLPDILFLDLNMPRKNGFQCLEEIKSNAELNPIPVIIYSTSLDEKIADQLYKNGAHHFICKPSDFRIFKRVIQHAIASVITKDNINNKQPSRDNFVIDISKHLSDEKN